MNNPLVSVCVPNLNTRSFLQERVDTILSQTYTTWEMIVSDNFSDDGSWQFFQELARQDSRVLIDQAPRDGLYANWNNCLRRARGKYIYIATSDDTMAPDCLEKLVTALERNKDCDLAHCPLLIIDEMGAPFAGPKWPHGTVFAAGSPELLHRPHIRRAPHDGLLHLVRAHVYLSITQLLIRRTLFARIGDFPSKWQSASDFNWEMKAGLVTNTVHVPDTWASWRRHANQATPMPSNNTNQWEWKVEDMIQDAFLACESNLDPAVIADLRSHWFDWTRDKAMYYNGLRQRRNVLRRRLFQLKQLFIGTNAARSELIRRVCGRPKWEEEGPRRIRLWLESLGLGSMILAEQQQAGASSDSLVAGARANSSKQLSAK